MSNIARVIKRGMGALVVSFSLGASADEMMRAYDIRCAPSVQYFSVAPMWVTTPENLLVPGPVEWDRGSFEAMRQEGLLFAELEQEYRCIIGGKLVRVYIASNSNLVVKLNDVVVFDGPSEWSTDDTGRVGNKFELSRTYELKRLELDREIWEISATAIPKDVYSSAVPFPRHVEQAVHTTELADKPPMKIIDQRYVGQ